MQRRNRRAALLALPLALSLTLAIPAVAAASIGVGIQVGPVRLAQLAHAGQTYDLPPVYVVNTGTQKETVRLAVQRLSSGTGRAVPRAWFRVTGQDVTLAAHQSARLPAQITVPADAKLGRYSSDVVVHGSASLSAGGASLGVAAATKLLFTVGRPVPAGFWSGLGAKLLLAVLIIAVLAGAVALARRSGLRIRVERSGAGYGSGDPEGER
jgi:hypothetical protein